jgi:(1->4)-alpha-D-glucan 1-alpha-D-glucosylmutase
VGAWPIGGDRLEGYLTKAIREAKIRTSWLDPHEKYESAVLDLARRAPVDRIARFVHMIAPDARVNSLGAKLVQLTMPGAADVYQGCELTGYSLVDPDNRRAVDFARRRTLLAGLDDPPHADPPHADLDTEKLLITTRALHCRRDHPAWFGNDYRPLTAHGPASGHVVAFARGGAVTVATRLPAGLRRRGGWQNTALQLEHAGWRDVLTGTTHTGDRLPLSELTRHFPVALLVAQRDGK